MDGSFSISERRENMLKETLEGKVALVTGAAGGIGRWGICPILAQLGVRLAVTDINDEKGKELAQNLGDKHRYYHLDVMRINSFPEVVERIWEDFGRIDLLVNNAGINLGENFLDMTPEGWDKVHGTNLRGHLFLSQEVVKRMIREGRKGVVVFTTSVHQEVCQRRLPYSTSKAALAMAIKEMALELGPYGIRVTGVAPGGIYITEHTTDRRKASRTKTVPLGGRNGLPQDIGWAVAFLVSDLATHITGEVLTVSGGQYLDPTQPHR